MKFFQLSLSIGFFDELKEHGAVEKLRKVYGNYLVSDGSDGKEITLEFQANSLPDDHEELANRAARLRRNCFAAVFEKYFEAQVNVSLSLQGDKKFSGKWFASKESSNSLQTR